MLTVPNYLCVLRVFGNRFQKDVWSTFQGHSSPRLSFLPYVKWGTSAFFSHQGPPSITRTSHRQQPCSHTFQVFHTNPTWPPGFKCINVLHVDHNLLPSAVVFPSLSIVWVCTEVWKQPLPKLIACRLLAL